MLTKRLQLLLVLTVSVSLGGAVLWLLPSAGTEAEIDPGQDATGPAGDEDQVDAVRALPEAAGDARVADAGLSRAEVDEHGSELGARELAATVVVLDANGAPIERALVELDAQLAAEP